MAPPTLCVSSRIGEMEYGGSGCQLPVNLINYNLWKAMSMLVSGISTLLHDDAMLGEL
jgi:hypothetical protein